MMMMRNKVPLGYDTSLSDVNFPLDDLIPIIIAQMLSVVSALILKYSTFVSIYHRLMAACHASTGGAVS